MHKDKPKSTREYKVSDYLKEQLDEHGIFYERINTTGVPCDEGMRKDLYALGRADFFIVYQGLAYAVETKSSKGKLRIGQELWQKRFEKAGGKHYVINSKIKVDEFIVSLTQC